MKKSTIFNKIVKLFAVVLCLAFILCAIPAGALESAARPLTKQRLEAPLLRAGNSGATFPGDTTELRNYLFEQFYSCPQTVDISQFNIPDTAENRSRMEDLVWFNLPECFQVNGLGVYGDGGIIRKLFASYYFSPEKYDEMFREVNAVAIDMVKDIKNASWLSDVQKALIIHDRLCVRCEYDYDSTLQGTVPLESYLMYGALIEGKAVCTGYTWAYMYLLRLVGIESIYATSETLNHAWNIVTIDGKQYHVDTTWDDPTFDMTGHVKHSFFMVSSAALRAERTARGMTDADDYNASPDNRGYDGYFWSSSQAEFVILGNSIYYFDTDKAELCRWDSSGRTSVKTLSEKWYASSTGYWKSNYTRISSDGKKILYSMPKSVFGYDPKTGKSEVIYSPEKAKSGYINIFGFTLRDGYLILDVGSTPNYTLTTKREIMIKIPYDISAPEGLILSADNAASSQTVTLKLSDDVKLAGYYWGTNSDYTKNTYKAVTGTDKSVTVSVSSKGKYYLTVKDESGNISETRSITFCEIKLDCDGGKADVDRIIAEKGKQITLPDAKKEGSAFNGWSKIRGGYVAEKVVTVKEDVTYYALWMTPEIIISAKSIMLTVGASAIITASTNVDVDMIEWYSTDEKTVVVKDGKITAVAAGIAEVSARIKYDDLIYSAACEVTVKSKNIVGDLNGDGKVNAVDTSIVKNVICGNLDINLYRTLADVNGDGKVNSIDANMLKRLVVGLD